MSEFIKCEKVSFQYYNDDSKPIPVLKDIDFSVKQGEFVALVGRNGCGKSTLAKHFNAISVSYTHLDVYKRQRYS